MEEQIQRDFSHLHLHTSHSRLDGLIEIPELMQYCKEHGMTSVAMTDHGNMSGAIEFYTEAKALGIKPIIGQEIYLVEDHTDDKSERFHEGLLSMNTEGYFNLVKLSTLGFTDGLQRGYFACIDDSQIQLYSAGLICLSGCISGRLARTVLRGLKSQKELITKAQNVELYSKFPHELDKAKAAARKLAVTAANAVGPKKARIIAEATSLRAELDSFENSILSGGTVALIDDLYTEARMTFERAWAQAQIIVEKRKSIFGDRYYLETQIVPLEDQITYNEYVRKIAELSDTKVVVTADSHYLRKEDAQLHRLMLKVRTDKRSTTKEKKEAVKIEFPQDQSDAILKSEGDLANLETLYDEILADEYACVGKKVNKDTKAYLERRRKWVQTAQIYYLQSNGEEAEVTDETVSLDAIDPGRAYSDWLAEFWVRTPQEMLDAGAKPEEMDNTLALSSRVNIELNINTDTNRVVHMPIFPVPDHTDEYGNRITWDYDTYLASICSENLRRYLDENPELVEQDYRSRLNYELGVIGPAGFSQYFLIVWDYINHVKSSGGLTGPGRGSCCASLVTFLLGITLRIDPLKYSDLMFERFLTPGRPDLPDIDTDFDYGSAEEVYKYCQEKYGSSRVSKIGTFSQIGVRQALQDIGRVLNIPYIDVERAAAVFKDYRPDDDQIAEDNRAMFGLLEVVPLVNELQTLQSMDTEHKNWFKYADALQGTRRNASQHASGVAMSSDNLVNLGVPLMTSKAKGKDPVLTTQFGMDDLAVLGIPKFDQLKLSNLNIIRETEVLIGDDFEIADINLSDTATFESLCKGDNLGIFQVSQNKVRGVMRAVQPRSLNDIAAIITIIRPGLLAKDNETGLTQEELYKARRQKSLPVTYQFKFLEPILNTTEGVMLYQEQTLKILWACGIDKLTADKIRKIMSKKKMSELLKYRLIFVPSAMKTQGLTDQEANDLWNVLEQFAAYSFNAAHAYAYGLIAYWTSYLKTHYPAQFMTATLTVMSQKKSKAAILMVPRLLDDCSQMGRNIPILPPSINNSYEGFSIEQSETKDGLTPSIRFGLASIKAVGSLAQAILADRFDNGAFRGLDDLMERINVRTGKRPSKTALTSLIYSGALDEFYVHRSEAIHELAISRETAKFRKEEMRKAVLTPERGAVLAQKQAELCGNYYFVKNNIDVLGEEVDNFFEGCREDKVRIGGRITEAKLFKTTRNGNKYHSVTLKTQWGDVKVDFFTNRRTRNPESYLQDLRSKLYSGSVIFINGTIRDDRSIFGQSVSLPKACYRGGYIEDLGKLHEEADSIIFRSLS